jgi:hypothetical protein
MAQLIIWSPRRRELLSCPLDETTWLDRTLLSAGDDPTLHRSPRCPAVRYMDHEWGLVSRDSSNEVFVAPYVAGAGLRAEAVEKSAQHVLPRAVDGFERYPVHLQTGVWLVSVGKWPLQLFVNVPAYRGDDLSIPGTGSDSSTVAGSGFGEGFPGHQSPNPPRPEAVSRARAYLERSRHGRLALAYYYQRYILADLAPQPVRMSDVAAALDLAGEAAVSEYKKELQRLIWGEQGHQHELAQFLIAHGLIDRADLDRAKQIAADNRREGKDEQARERLRYRTSPRAR